ncbi:zinc finger protein 69 homolog, partial [Physella acuta]
MHLLSGESVSPSELRCSILEEKENLVQPELTAEPVITLSKQRTKKPADTMFAAHCRTHLITKTSEATNRNGSELCDVCHYVFKSTEHLSMHKLVHTRLKCYICTMCNIGYNNDIDYDTHIRTHFKFRPFHCEICEKSYTMRKCLKVHMRKHTGEFYYTCDKCDFTSNTNSSFAQHKKRQHPSTKPFKCDTCDYAAIGKSSLTRHLITHTGEKPYCCGQYEYRCNKL